jgi:ABC-type oligopeptide transport system ATPase subunit
VNVTRVRKTFATRRGFSAWGLSFAGGWPRLRYKPTQVTAVDGVSLSISPGEVPGLVGESGCGKSTLGRLALQLLRQTEGSVEFDGTDLGQLPGSQLRAFRTQAQIMFQNVSSSIKNPRSKLRGIGGRKEADQKNAASCGEYVPKEIEPAAVGR